MPLKRASEVFWADGEAGFAGSVFEVHLNHVFLLLKNRVCVVLSLYPKKNHHQRGLRASRWYIRTYDDFGVMAYSLLRKLNYKFISYYALSCCYIRTYETNVFLEENAY